VTVEHTRYSFRNSLPDNPRTAYSADVVIIISGSENWMETNQYSHAATASTRSLSSSGVHGVNLGRAMVGRRGGGKTEKLNGREEGRVESTTTKAGPI